MRSSQEIHAIFYQVTFKDNRCGTNYYGGGVYVRDGSTVILELCIFESNSAPGDWGRGGAMYIDNGNNVEIKGSVFTSNSANSNENSGGAIWVHSGYVELSGSSFLNNAPNDLTRNGGTIGEAERGAKRRLDRSGSK